MKWLIVSDNHKDKYVVGDLVAIYKDKVDAFIHCGDTEMSASDMVWQDYLVVQGNNDFDKKFPMEVVEQLGDYTVFIAHGHTFGVRQTLSDLIEKAKEAGATFAFFGHTHVPTIEKVDGVWVINPGSINKPRQADHTKSYMILTLHEDASFTAEYYDDNHQPIPNQKYEYDI